MHPQMQNLATMAHIRSHKPLFLPKIIGTGVLLRHLIHEIPLCGLKVVMWYTMKAKQINGPIWH